MNHEKIIIILLVVVMILAVLVGVTVLQPMFSKEPCCLKISDRTLYEGDDFYVKLMDGQENPISDGKINIKVSQNGNEIINKDFAVNDSGIAKFTLDEKGTYKVDCSFSGDNQYASNFTSKNLTVHKASTKSISSKQTSNFNSVSGLSNDGYSYFPDYGPDVDSLGVTKEYAKHNNWHYIPQTIDGRDAGVYVPYDSKAGCYHT